MVRPTLSARRVVGNLAFAALLAPTLAPGAALADSARYDACLTLVEQDPAAALAAADSFAQEGGGAAARHCRAAALEAAGRIAEAAAELEALAPVAGSSAVRASLYAQLGDLRLEMDDSYSARIAYENALVFAPGNRTASIGRARAFGAQGEWREAYDALSEIIAAGAPDAETLALRAAAARRLGLHEQALADASSALWADGANALALFERGAAKAMLDDLAGAEADWRQAAALDPGGPAGEMAAQNLARLAARQEP